MDYLSSYLWVLQHDLRRLGEMLIWFGGPMLLLAAVCVPLAAVRCRLQRWFLWEILRTAGEGTFVWLGSFLLGWALAIQLCRGLNTSPALLPLAFWPALGAIGFALAVTIAYRRTVRRMSAACPGFESKEVDQTPRRWRFSIGTFFLIQFIVILAIGLWLECRRDWVTQRHKDHQYLLARFNWMADVDRRYGELGWTTDFGNGQEPCVWLDHQGLLPSFEDANLSQIRLEDGLVGLEVRSPALTDAGLKTIARHLSLVELELDSNEITDAGIGELARLPNLISLTITSDKLTDRALVELARIPRLQTLQVSGSRFSRQAVRDLQAKHPRAVLLVNPKQSAQQPAS